MARVCPVCGGKIEGEICPNCGYNINNVDNSRRNMINHNTGKSDNSKKIIIGLGIVILVIILLFGIFAFGLHRTSNSILTVGDLELNMTGFDYHLEKNTTLNGGSITGYSASYSVSGDNDNFKLTVIVINGSYGSEKLKNLGSQLFGTVGTVSTTRYINGNLYWIQISSGNSQHNNQAFLESIIITKGEPIPTEYSPIIINFNATPTNIINNSQGNRGSDNPDGGSVPSNDSG